MLMEPKIYTVTQINRYIRGIFENDFILRSMWIKGEISNFKAHGSGHLYFTLKDENSAISCIMFRENAQLLYYEPQNGMSVTICGYISLYEKTGQYQLYVELMEPEGIGSLAVAFEQLKEKLSNEGLFDPDFKREICPHPKKIALITSPTGAAVRDMIHISKRRNPAVSLVVVPVLVQGEFAADSIVNALKMVNQSPGIDTIILGRGGGSMEDLWAFNEEKVARAIFASQIPVISAVGHETDFTISDFVADLRAPTPSAAAELAVDNAKEEKEWIENLNERMNFALSSRIEAERQRLATWTQSRTLRRIKENLVNARIYLEHLQASMGKDIHHQLEKKEDKFFFLIERLESLSPLAVLKRGYALITDQEEHPISYIQQVQEGTQITALLQDGKILAKVEGRIAYGKKETLL